MSRPVKKKRRARVPRPPRAELFRGMGPDAGTWYFRLVDTDGTAVTQGCAARDTERKAKMLLRRLARGIIAGRILTIPTLGEPQ